MPNNEFTTLNKKVHRGGAYYISCYNIWLLLESEFQEYNFEVNIDIANNAVAVSISKALFDDDIGKREIHIACTEIPFEIIEDDDNYRIIRQIIQDAIDRR